MPPKKGGKEKQIAPATCRRRAAPPPPPPLSTSESDQDQAADEPEQSPRDPSPSSQSDGAQSEGQSEAHTEALEQKRSKKSCRLRDEQEEAQVLEWVRGNPLIWNPKHKEYRAKTKKDRMWEDKAREFGYNAADLVRWYKDLRDWNTKLHSCQSGGGTRNFTDRECWVMDQFMFLSHTIRHRRAAVKSVKEAIAGVPVHLDKAKPTAAEDWLALQLVDEDDAPQPSPCCRPAKKQRKDKGDDPLLAAMQKRVQEAQQELATVRGTIVTAEPVTERTAFLDWVKQVIKNSSEDQFTEFQTTFINMQARWKLVDRGLLQPQQFNH